MSQQRKSEQVRKGWGMSLPVNLYTFALKSKNFSPRDGCPDSPPFQMVHIITLVPTSMF